MPSGSLLQNSPVRHGGSQARRRQAALRACLEALEGRQLLSLTPAGDYAVSSSPRAIATADFNNDGNLDLAADVGSGATGKVSVRLGDGLGGFGTATEFAAPLYGYARYLFVADLNNDTTPDIITSDGGSGHVVLIGNGDGTFQSQVNVDGYGLVYVGQLQPTNAVVGIRTWLGADWETHVQLMWGDGQGGFTPAGQDGQYWGYSPGMAPINLNDDPYLDVVTGEGAVFTGENWGLWFDWNQLPPLGNGLVETGDFTGDGYDDVVAINNSIAILCSNGDGTLAEPILHSSNGFALSDVATADFDADGTLDVVVADLDMGTATVLLGNGDGTLRFGGAFATGDSPSSLTVGDFNGDGRPDLAVANGGVNSVSVLLNDGNWENLPPAPLKLFIRDTSITEGDSGTLNATFTVGLTRSAEVAVTVQYETENITATDPDYVAAFGTLTIPAGQTSQTITVAIRGDRIAEPTEAFAVNLSNPTNATIVDGEAIGTIFDNDPVPAFTINDVTRAEGNSATTSFTFTVTLSVASEQTLQVNYATANGTATSSAGKKDFQATSGTLVFPAGVTTRTVTVSVVGDKNRESDEHFSVNLSQAPGGLISDSYGLGVILNDDAGGGKQNVSGHLSIEQSPSGVPGGKSQIKIAPASHLPAMAPLMEASTSNEKQESPQKTLDFFVV